MVDVREKEHLAWLEKLAEEARNKLIEKRTQLNQLTAEVDKLAADDSNLQRALETVRSSFGLPSPKLVRTRFQDMTIKAAAEIAMSEAGGQMRTVDLVKALREGGKELGERAYSVVVATLGRSDRFEKVDRGVFRLVPK